MVKEFEQTLHWRGYIDSKQAHENMLNIITH